MDAVKIKILFQKTYQFSESIRSSEKLHNVYTIRYGNYITQIENWTSKQF